MREIRTTGSTGGERSGQTEDSGIDKSLQRPPKAVGELPLPMKAKRASPRHYCALDGRRRGSSRTPLRGRAVILSPRGYSGLPG